MKIKKLGVFLTALSVIAIGQAEDVTYDPATGVITIPEVAVNDKVEFANVKLKANSDGTLSVLSTEAPKSSPTTTYDPATDTVTIPSVAVNGKVEYENVKLGLNSDGTLSVLSTETPILSYPANQQDESSQIKPEAMSLARSLYDGWNYLGTLDGYTVEYRSFSIGSDVVYQFLGTSGATQLGFGCVCAVVNGTKTWQGMSNSSCGPANPNVAIALNSQIMGSYSINVGMPGGACCKSVPRVGTTDIPGLLSFCGG